MPKKEIELFLAVEKNNIQKVKDLLSEKDSFDVNWKNPEEVNI